MGKWESFIGQTTKRSGTPASPSALKKSEEYKRAARTIQPHLNEERNRVQSKKILNISTSYGWTGNTSSVLKKTSSSQDLNKFGIRVYKEKYTRSEDTPVNERRILKGHPSKMLDWSSQIAGLPSPTSREESRSPSASRKRFASPMMNQHSTSFMRESASERNLGLDDSRVLSPKNSARKQLARFLDTSVDNEQYRPPSIQRRNPNKESLTNDYDDNRLNPLSKGKRSISREQSRENLNVYDSMERINPLTKGKKLVSPRTSVSTSLYSRPTSEALSAGKARSIYSYRTFASQIPI